MARHFEVPPVLMGVTFVALGLCFADGVSSVLMARNGFGDMAVGNAVGYGVFSLTVGTGAPIFVASLVRGGSYVDVPGFALTQILMVLAIATVTVVLFLAILRYALVGPAHVVRAQWQIHTRY